MITKIKICRKSQKEPAFKEINNDNFNFELEIHGFCILEKGMASGKTALGIALKKGGRYYMTQISADQINYLKSAIDGAEKNWKENPE